LAHGVFCFYEHIFEGFISTVQTTDVDFYVPDAKRIETKGNVIDALKGLDFDLVRDTLTAKSRFISPDNFEIEFLANLTKDGAATIRLGNAGIYAETLPYVNIFSGSYITVDFEGVVVKVASPASFCLQKLLIWDRRSPLKQAKDLDAVNNVLIMIRASRKSREDFYDLFDSLPRSWAKKIQRTAQENDISFPDRI
jgi:hypothetical protein